MTDQNPPSEMECLHLIALFHNYLHDYENEPLGSSGMALPSHSPEKIIEVIDNALPEEAWRYVAPGQKELIARAGLIASRAIAGFIFKGERRDDNVTPAIRHTKTVANTFIGDEDEELILQTISNLHDIIEDGFGWTFAHLRECGFSERIVKAVVAITREVWPTDKIGNFIKEPYFDYIERLSLNPDAIQVKLADIDHNLEDAPTHRQTRYLVARSYLIAVQEKEILPGSSVMNFINHHADDEIKILPDLRFKLLKESSAVQSNNQTSAYMTVQNHHPRILRALAEVAGSSQQKLRA